MDVPSKANKTWADVVSGKKVYPLKFLAAKILLGRLVQSVKENPSAANVNSAVEQLHTLFTKNAHMPSVQNDLKTIFG